MEVKDIQVEGEDIGHNGFVVITDRDGLNHGYSFWFALILPGTNHFPNDVWGMFEIGGNKESEEL